MASREVATDIMDASKEGAVPQVSVQLWKRSEFPGWANNIRKAAITVQWTLQDSDALIAYILRVKHIPAPHLSQSASES
jgi:hypothetical protein